MVFPKVLFLDEGKEIVRWFPTEGKEFEIVTRKRLPKEPCLRGLFIDSLDPDFPAMILIYFQPLKGRIITFIHEIFHWINSSLLNSKRIDNWIDKIDWNIGW